MSVVVMGVSGSGKSTIGAALAVRLESRFVDADDLHPLPNIEKMAAGVPLDDTDRVIWLTAVCQELGRGDVVLACSALKRRYRDQMRAADPDLQLVYLGGDAETIIGRMAGRPGHFMPVSLLASQLDDLEPPNPDEHALELNVTLPPARMVEQAVRAMRIGSTRDSPGPHPSFRQLHKKGEQ